MAATNSTTNLALPIFVDSDKPTWRGDFNDAMQKIEDAHNSDSLELANLRAQIVSLEARLTAGGL